MPLPVVVVGLMAAVSCALSAFALMAADGAAPASGSAATPERTQGLEERVALLERRLDDLAQLPAAPLMEVSGGTGDRMRADLDSRLAELEQRVVEDGSTGAATDGTHAAAAGEEPEGAPEEGGKRASGRPKRGTAQHLTWARQRTLDVNLTPIERSDALGEIQKHGADGYTDDVVHSMIVLGQTSEDPKVRANVWRQFDGAHNPQLSSALVQALTSDQHPDARREAAEALDHFRDDPGVRSALERASQQDTDQEVRWEALRALRKPMK